MSLGQRRIRALGRLIGRCALQLPLDSAREVCGNVVVTGTALPEWYEILPRDVIGAELLRLLRDGLPHLERSAATFNRLRAEEAQILAELASLSQSSRGSIMPEDEPTEAFDLPISHMVGDTTVLVNNRTSDAISVVKQKLAAQLPNHMAQLNVSALRVELDNDPSPSERRALKRASSQHVAKLTTTSLRAELANDPSPSERRSLKAAASRQRQLEVAGYDA